MPLTENQTRFIAALRSGEYEQSSASSLNRGGTCFCAMGVAMELFHPEKARPTDPERPAAEWGYPCESRLHLITSAASPAVIEKLGLRNKWGGPCTINFVDIVYMNDKGMTFEQIANVIETHPEEFFVDATPTA